MTDPLKIRGCGHNTSVERIPQAFKIQYFVAGEIELLMSFIPSQLHHVGGRCLSKAPPLQ